MCGTGFLRDLLYDSRGNPGFLPTVLVAGVLKPWRTVGWERGGHLTSRCWQRGTRTGGCSQMGLRALALAFHRGCWVQPGTELWCLMDTTRSDHRASSWLWASPIPLSRE